LRPDAMIATMVVTMTKTKAYCRLPNLRRTTELAIYFIPNRNERVQQLYIEMVTGRSGIHKIGSISVSQPNN